MAEQPTHDALHTEEKPDSREGSLGDESDEPEIGPEDDIETGMQAAKSSQSNGASTWVWADDPNNPYNWSNGRKTKQIVMISAQAFLASVGTSILSPAHGQFMEEFGVTSTQAILPLSMYVFALGLGPIVGGPLSETVGRWPVFLGGVPLGALFTLGAGFTHNFVALCILRFLAGFAFSPSLAISSGTINETYTPAKRGLPSTIFVLMPFLGPGLGPVIGSFVVNRKGWRWTQWTMIFFAIFAIICALLGEETYHPILKRHRAEQLRHPLPEKTPFRKQLRTFATVALIRPVHMLLTEPIVGLTSLYVSCMFATLFTFFAAVPYVFQSVYHFSIEQTGLVFLSIVVGCVLGAVTIMVCNVIFYLPASRRYPLHQTPPEYRLYPAMIGSIGMPIALFWFGWTARTDISWASPVVAIIPFAWGNLCLFISSIQYLSDTYHGTTIASASSANSLLRYSFAGGFPLFTLQMYSKLGIGWASSLLAFIALALMPVPWLFFKFGQTIRMKSKYETANY